MRTNIQALTKLAHTIDVMTPLSEGDSGTRQLQFDSREIYNRIIQWISKNFSADIALQFKTAVVGTKIAYTTDDTDVSSALKTILNLISQINLANTLENGPRRHLQWPLYEIIELIESKDLLKSIFLEKDWRDTFALFGAVWHGFEKFLDISQPKKLPNQASSHPRLNTINTLIADLKEIIDEDQQIKVNDIKSSEVQEDYFNLGHVDDVPDLSKKYLHSQSTFQRIIVILQVIITLKLGSIDDNSTSVKKLTHLLREVFIYLDYLEMRLGISELFTHRFKNDLLKFINSHSSNQFVSVLNKNLDIQNDQFFVSKRLEISNKRIKNLDKAIAAETMPSIFNKFYTLCLQLENGEKLSPEDILFIRKNYHLSVVEVYLESIQYPFGSFGTHEFLRLTNRFVQKKLPKKHLDKYKNELSNFVKHFTQKSNHLRGLHKTLENTLNLQKRLTNSENYGTDNLKLLQSIEQTRITLNHLKDQLQPIPDELQDLLSLLTKNLESLHDIMKSNPFKIVELVDKYHGMQRIYARLTYKIPLTCRFYLQENIQKIEDAMSQMQQHSPDILQACQKNRQALDEAHGKTIIFSLTSLEEKANEFATQLEEINSVHTPSTVSTITTSVSSLISGVTHYLQGDKSKPLRPEPDADTADTLDYIVALIKNINNLKAFQMSGADMDIQFPVINAISRNIFELRQLARKTLLDQNPRLASFWKELNKEIDYLRERDDVFARAIANTKPEVALENAQWCSRLGLGNHLPPLPAPSTHQILKTIHEKTASIHDKLVSLIENQPQDSLYHRALHQNKWRKFSFNDEDTTETYTMKLFLNMFFQIHEATHPKISGLSSLIPHLEWVKRLRQLPIQEIAALMDELPIFIVNSGIWDLALESLTLAKTLISGISVQSNLNITEVLTKSDDPTVSAFHALANSGLISEEVPKLMKMVARISRISHNHDIIKLKEQNEFKPKSTEIAYYRLESETSLFVNFAKNVGVFFWNNIGRHFVNLKIIQQNFSNVRTEYTGIANDVADIITAPEEIDLDRKKALAETGRQIRSILIRLDKLAANTGLVEHQSILKKVSEKIFLEARYTDHITKSKLLTSEWKIIGDQPFLIERIESQQNELSGAQTKIVQLRQEIPDAVRQFIEIMKKSSITKTEEKNLKENREVILQFLKKFIQDKHQGYDNILKKLAETHAKKLKNMENDGESKLQITKAQELLSRQYKQFDEKLHNLFKIKVEQADAFFDSVLDIETPDLRSFSDFSKNALHSLEEVFAEHLASHDRAQRSLEQQIKNLDQALIAKKKTLKGRLRMDCDILFSQLLSFKREPSPTRMRIFKAKFLSFCELCKSVQSSRLQLDDFKLRHDIKLLCDAVVASPHVYLQAVQVAQETSQGEIQFFTQELLKTLSKLEVQPKDHLLQLMRALAAGTVRVDMAAFARQVAEFLREQPKLRKSFQEYAALFPGLEFAISTELRQQENDAKNRLNGSPHLFHQPHPASSVNGVNSYEDNLHHSSGR